MLATFLKSSYLTTLIGILMLGGCNPIQKNNLQEVSVSQLAIENLGNDFELQPSATGAYVLVIEKVSPTAANPITKFVVIESSSKKIVLKKSFRPGYVKWVENSVLEIFDAPGILKQFEDESSYITKVDIATYKN